MPRNVFQEKYGFNWWQFTLNVPFSGWVISMAPWGKACEIVNGLCHLDLSFHGRVSTSSSRTEPDLLPSNVCFAWCASYGILWPFSCKALNSTMPLYITHLTHLIGISSCDQLVEGQSSIAWWPSKLYALAQQEDDKLSHRLTYMELPREVFYTLFYMPIVHHPGDLPNLSCDDPRIFPRFISVHSLTPQLDPLSEGNMPLPLGEILHNASKWLLTKSYKSECLCRLWLFLVYQA